MEVGVPSRVVLPFDFDHIGALGRVGAVRAHDVPIDFGLDESARQEDRPSLARILMLANAEVEEVPRPMRVGGVHHRLAVLHLRTPTTAHRVMRRRATRESELRHVVIGRGVQGIFELEVQVGIVEPVPEELVMV